MAALLQQLVLLQKVFELDFESILLQILEKTEGRESTYEMCSFFCFEFLFGDLLNLNQLT